jgi:3-carboxy-cis,cis-muconate cycloisomerase
MQDVSDALYTTPAMAALFSGAGHFRRMLDFEAGLARAEGRAGVIPADAAQAISAVCRVDLYDVPSLLQETASVGAVVTPFVRALTAKAGSEAGRYVHWGSTTQDVIDTALVLQMRDGLDLLEAGLLEIGGYCAALAEEHRQTPMAGRTLLQQALPVTFGLRAARWLALVTRQIQKLRAVRSEALALQFGGAAGTLASLGADGARVAELLAEELHLPAPDLPWHGERDRVAEVAAALGILAGAMGKIAQDVLLLSQTEVGEVSEGAAPGKGGSSTLPHKRNPVDSVGAAAAARLAQSLVPVILGSMIQEHERAVGGWQAEWAALPEIFRYTSAAVEKIRLTLAALEVHPERMRANLDLTRGLLMAESLSMVLAKQLGKQAAYQVVKEASQQAVRQGDDLESVARADARISGALSSDEIAAALDPGSYLGATDQFIDRALAAFRAAAGATAPA